MSYYAPLKVKVLPRSSRSEIVGYQGDMLKVKLRSAPVDNAANDELIELLSDALNKPKSYIKIKYGHAARVKTVHILVESEQELRDELG